jgi:succinylglutamate desuccinylase
LQFARAERFQHSDLARLLNHKRDLRAQNAQRRDEHDEKQQVKHDVFFDDERGK